MISPNQRISKNELTGRISVETVNEEPSLTQQQFAADCDINNIMKKYQTTGEFTHATSKQGRYADFSDISDYPTMLQTVIYAQDAFASLPAEMRKRFDNDPGKLLEFIHDPKNYAEGVQLGLLNPKTDPKTGALINEQTQTNDKPAPQTQDLKPK